jgi:excinuclease ABC subunit A
MSKYLEVIWAKTHNLQNVNVKIPKNKMTVITWVSWSGKSSLAFNTIYNVWQQKYLESLSSYARMFIGWMNEEADVSEINWLSPTISIDQKTTSKNPRSTVWTITEIYDYYKLLYLNVWERKCINCNTVVKKDSMLDIINFLSSLDEEAKFILKAPIKWKFTSFDDIKKEVLGLWFIRFSVNNQIHTINDNVALDDIWKVHIIIDRLVNKDFSDKESSDTKRLKDSLELAYKIWEWQIFIEVVWWEEFSFSNVFICSNCWHIPTELNISSFSFNSHTWACPECHWLWVKKVFLEEKIINRNLTLLEWAVIAPWFWWDYFFALLQEIWKKNKINLNTNYSLLSKRETDLILYWTWDKMYSVTYTNEYWIKNTYNSRYEWVINTLTRRYFEWWNEKWVYDDYVIDMDCHICDGHRLNKESLNVFVNGLNIWELSNLAISDALKFINTIKLSVSQEKISKKILKNAIERLEFLSWVWLTYMTISRKAWTLSGWEAQRIRLATQIWTKLEWIIYVLDEPSIWLHPRDNDMLIDNLKKLRDIWNTLIIVEHDEDIMRESDHIIDIWPWAWVHGGQIISEWTMQEIINDKNSITWPYLKWTRNVIIKRWFRPSFNDLKKNWKVLDIIWANQHNLKNIDITIPLSNFVVVTWVSWSGKSSLINDILANYLANNLNRAKRDVWLVKSITWLKNLDKVVIIDQSPIWKTPRSNPATYTGVFTAIRDVFALSEESQIRWFGPGRFSFNTKQWRCSYCDWDWVKKIEMHFLPPVYIECESCNGKRYNSETLQIKYKWKTIADVLNMTVEESLDFFSNHPKINKILKVLDKVWLWYIKLWQSSVTLSGWEAQRIKLSTELSKRSTGKTFYILDEPTTGLHFQDVDKLLTILHSLVNKWNSVLVIEHNMDVIMNADHIIDIWPEWWDKWWEVMVYWTVEDVKNCKKSFTWIAIKKYINK